MVRALSEASLGGGDYFLTGPAALSHARQVAVIGEGRETAGSWPPSAVEMLLAAGRRSGIPRT